MAGRITRELKDSILARTDIVDLVGNRVALKKAGGLFKACCPFHTEKTPSFTVSPTRQTYHCFGCGAHGNVIDFLIEMDRLSFVEAVEELAQRAGVEIPDDDGSPRPQGPDLKPLYAILERAAAFYRRQLREHPDARRAVEYLKSRGLSGEIAGRYGVGYSPPGRDVLLSALGQSGGERGYLIQAGLVIEQDGRRYDRFRDRVLFPILDRRGRVIGFGGRVLGDGQPKYLNSPETPVFHKGRELYGLYQAQRARRTLERLVVVEGYMDVIALAQFGIDYAVATLGTATTPEHIQLLMRSAPELVFCFDGDKAGREAAWKALETALPFVTGAQTLRFLLLPEGEDPDTLIRARGADVFGKLVADAAPLSEFLFDQLGDRVGDLVSIDGRTRLASLAGPLIQRIPVGMYRQMIEAELARVAGLEPAAPAGPRPPSRSTRSRSRPNRPTRPSRVAQAISLILDRPGLAEVAASRADDWRRLDNPGIRILAELIDTIAAYPRINQATLLDRWRDHEHYSYLKRLCVEPFLRHVPEEGAKDELMGALDGLSEMVRRSEALRPFSVRSTSDWSAELREQVQRELADPRMTDRRPGNPGK
jgi:DNA primase